MHHRARAERDRDERRHRHREGGELRAAASVSRELLLHHELTFRDADGRRGHGHDAEEHHRRHGKTRDARPHVDGGAGGETTDAVGEEQAAEEPFAPQGAPSAFANEEGGDQQREHAVYH